MCDIYDIYDISGTVQYYRMQLHSDNENPSSKTFMEINTLKISTNTKRDYFGI
jgi:hypothetical protein